MAWLPPAQMHPNCSPQRDMGRWANTPQNTQSSVSLESPQGRNKGVEMQATGRTSGLKGRQGVGGVRTVSGTKAWGPVPVRYTFSFLLTLTEAQGGSPPTANGVSLACQLPHKESCQCSEVIPLQRHSQSTKLQVSCYSKAGQMPPAAAQPPVEPARASEKGHSFGPATLGHQTELSPVLGAQQGAGM